MAKKKKRVLYLAGVQIRMFQKKWEISPHSSVSVCNGTPQTYTSSIAGASLRRRKGQEGLKNKVWNQACGITARCNPRAASLPRSLLPHFVPSLPHSCSAPAPTAALPVVAGMERSSGGAQSLPYRLPKRTQTFKLLSPLHRVYSDQWR